MTGHLVLDLAISLGGIVLLVALSYTLGAFRTVTVTEETARERLAFDEPDFRPSEWFVGADQKSAAVLSQGGAETALVFAVGDGLATRRFRQGSVSVEHEGTDVLFILGEPSRRAVRLKAVDGTAAERWVLRLAGRRL